MIDPRLVTLQDLFTDRIHYEVPIYQRPYVWGKDEQWVPLWEDVVDAANGRLAGQPMLAHFLGAIVIELRSADPGRVKVFSVIDGQQRLTTLQVLLASLRAVAQERDESRVSDLERMLRNEGRHADGPLAFKVWPSEDDRAAFRGTVRPEGGAAVPTDETGIPGAYHYFKAAIDEWLGTDDNATDRLDALQDAIEGLLQVVAIQLDGSSDAQIIFETLNSRGADLTSLDLAKNSLLRQAARDGVNVGELHATYWQPALGDGKYWLETVRQGRYTSERADLFLMHWLTMRTGKTPRVQRLFADFRRLVMQADPPAQAADIVKELGADATTYRSFDDLDRASVEGRFFHRLDLMDTTTLIPVALLLFRSNELTVERRQRAVRALESWLVRRMMLGATTQHYNRLLATLLSRLREQHDLTTADVTIIEVLRGFENETDRWPTDAEVTHRLLRVPLYGWINQRRIRVLLEACEEQIAATPLTEQLLLPEKLTIEHAMPQTWADNWPLTIEDDGDPDHAVEDRDAHIHLLGNLTLVTRGLNSTLSNAPWPVKRAELAERSQLLVNQHLCANETWEEEHIDARGTELCGFVLRTWPGPDAEVWLASPDVHELEPAV
jgi:Protein of unknown function DUF262/Protein of unknown function (DUF1524)